MEQVFCVALPRFRPCQLLRSLPSCPSRAPRRPTCEGKEGLVWCSLELLLLRPHLGLAPGPLLAHQGHQLGRLGWLPAGLQHVVSHRGDVLASIALQGAGGGGEGADVVRAAVWVSVPLLVNGG
jgi:hypothetical protein